MLSFEPTKTRPSIPTSHSVVGQTLIPRSQVLNTSVHKSQAHMPRENERKWKGRDGWVPAEWRAETTSKGAAAPGVQEWELTPARKLQVLGKAACSDVLCGIFSFAQADCDGQYPSAVQTSLCRQGKPHGTPSRSFLPDGLSLKAQRTTTLYFIKRRKFT